MKLTNSIVAAVYPRAGEGVSPGTSFRSSAEVYPRVRGVNLNHRSTQTATQGLSPHTRENGARMVYHSHIWGLSPHRRGGRREVSRIWAW